MIDGLRLNFTAFYKDLQNEAEPSELTEFVAGGIENLATYKKGEAVDPSTWGRERRRNTTERADKRKIKLRETSL